MLPTITGEMEKEKDAIKSNIMDTENDVLQTLGKICNVFTLIHSFYIICVSSIIELIYIIYRREGFFTLSKNNRRKRRNSR